MTGIKAIAVLILLGLLGGLGWVITHLRGIKRELQADEAMPKPSPRANFLLLVAVVLTALSALMTYFLVS